MSKLHRLTLAAVLLGALLSAPTLYAALPPSDSQGAPLPTLAPMLEKVTPAVVNIATRGRVRVQENPFFNDPFFRHFFDVPTRPRERVTQSLGSGVIVDAQRGYVLTNHHVVAKADEITVTLQDERQLQATLIGADPDTDVAVIQVPAERLVAIQMGDSDTLRVGDFVVAIGNPFGLGQTVTSGIISALGRSGLGIEGYEDFIQTDASINPGNSGGALVSLRGELVGINTAILSQSGGNIGIGFAIPIRMAHGIMEQLIAHGEVRRGKLGAQAQDVTPPLAQAFGIEQQGGAVVTKVLAGSPADEAGLQVGDIITAINDKQVRDAGTLRNTVGLLRIGEEVRLSILRSGKPLTLRARVAEPETAQHEGQAIHPRLAGATLAEIDEGSPLYGQVEGIVVISLEPGSAALAAGLRQGDVIVSANRIPTPDLQALDKALRGSKSLLLNIQRGSAALFLYIQ